MIAAAVPLCLLVNAGVSLVADSTSPSGVSLGPAERCPAALGVVDAKNDTRSWLLPTPPGLEIPASADLRRFEVLATASGVCVRWTTAAPAPSGTILVFFALGPPVRLAGGGAVHPGYGVNLELREKSAWATFGLDRTGREPKRNVLRVRAGRTGPVVSVFIPRAELDRPKDNFGNHPRFPTARSPSKRGYSAPRTLTITAEQTSGLRSAPARPATSTGASAARPVSTRASCTSAADD